MVLQNDGHMARCFLLSWFIAHSVQLFLCRVGWVSHVGRQPRRVIFWSGVMQFKPQIALFFLALLPFTVIGCAKSPVDNGPRAVFLIVVDTLRPDRLSCYGSNNPTPSIDRLAERGTTFYRAQSTASWTVPSVGAILTSMYPSQLGLVEEPAPMDTDFPARERRRQISYTLPQSANTLAETLRDSGFRTAAFVNQPFLNFRDGFLQGFTDWRYPVSETELVWHDTEQPIPVISYPPGTDLGLADSLLVESFVEWLEEHDSDRPFVWLHLLKPHWPYRPPPRFMEGYVDDYYEAQSYQRYDGEIRAVDDLVGRVLDAIDSFVGLDRSLVVFTSDHGEAFGEHDGREHGHTLHREVVNVPLILAGPGLAPRERVGDFVATLSILPTILEIAGLTTAETHGPPSLLEVVRGEATPGFLFAEGMLYGGTERSLLKDGYKLIYEVAGGEVYRLYNLSTDPLENHDAGNRLSMRREDMRILMENFHAGLIAETTNETPSDKEDDDVLRSLKALGYIGGD